MSRLPRILLVLAVAAIAVAAAGFGLSQLVWSSEAHAAEKEAKTVATEFFAAMNARRYARVCDMLSSDFYRLNRVPSRKICELGLRYGMGFRSIRFEVLGAKVEGGRAIVRAHADGVPGQLTLVRENGRYRILSIGARR